MRHLYSENPPEYNWHSDPHRRMREWVSAHSRDTEGHE